MTRHAGTFTITIVLISLSSFSASLAQGLQISDVIDAVNARLSAFKLIGVPLPQILDFPATAIYEMRRISNDAPAVQFKPREYVLPYNLTQDPKKYSVGDFCTAIRYTKDPSELKLVNAVRRLRNDRENEMARLAEQGILEVALGAYVVTANLFDAGHRSIISLLGTAVDDSGEPPDGLYSTPPAHYSFGAIAKEGTKPFLYREPETYFYFNGDYIAISPIFGRRNFRKKLCCRL